MDQKKTPEEPKKDAPPAAVSDKKPTDDQNSGSSLPKAETLDVDTTQEGQAAGSNNTAVQVKKKNPLKSIWDRFNLYLLLFILVLVVAAAAVALLTIKSKNSAASSSGTVKTQNLSANALKQLASTGVTVGSPNQVLNVESSAVFAGTVLVRSNLEVAGSLQVSDNLSLPSLTVSGVSTLAQIQAQNLVLTGPANIQGLLTAKSGIDVNGDGSFTGTVTTANLVTNSLQLNGSLVFTHHVTAGGQIPRLAEGNALGSGGTASVSGSDTAGSITINTGSSPSAGCFATITFTQSFSITPHVVVTPIGAGSANLNYYVNRTTTTMSVCTTSPAAGGVSFGFDYIIFD